MTVQDTPTLRDIAALQQARPAESAKPAARPARRLPVQKDWPVWALVLAQAGILVTAIAGWELGARTGLVDAFFW